MIFASVFGMIFWSIFDTFRSGVFSFFNVLILWRSLFFLKKNEGFTNSPNSAKSDFSTKVRLNFYPFSHQFFIIFHDFFGIDFCIDFYMDFWWKMVPKIINFGSILVTFWWPFSEIELWSTFGCILGTIWLPFGSLLAPFGSLWAPFGSLWGPFGSLWGPFGVPLAPVCTLLSPFGSILAPIGSLLSPFGSFYCLQGCIFSLLMLPGFIFMHLRTKSSKNPLNLDVSLYCI